MSPRVLYQVHYNFQYKYIIFVPLTKCKVVYFSIGDTVFYVNNTEGLEIVRIDFTFTYIPKDLDVGLLINVLTSKSVF